MENQVEIWKSHPDIPGVEVSTLGRVRTLDKVTSSEKMTRFTKGQVLKPFVSNNGYMMVHIRIDGKQTNKYVHRLVAQAFLPNPDNLPQVNHLDCDRTNNNVENLEFCDNYYNQKYREEFGKASGRPVFAVNLTTLEVSRFRSQHEASRSLGLFNQSINKVIKGRIKQAGGFWFVKDDGHAVDVVKSKLHDVGGVGLKIK